MNNARRGQIKKAKGMLDAALDILNDVMSEEDFAFNNLSEGFQQTMRGEQMEENVDILQNVIDQIEEAMDDLDNIE